MWNLGFYHTTHQQDLTSSHLQVFHYMTYQQDLTHSHLHFPLHDIYQQDQTYSHIQFCFVFYQTACQQYQRSSHLQVFHYTTYQTGQRPSHTQDFARTLLSSCSYWVRSLMCEAPPPPPPHPTHTPLFYLIKRTRQWACHLQIKERVDMIASWIRVWTHSCLIPSPPKLSRLVMMSLGIEYFSGRHSSASSSSSLLAK